MKAACVVRRASLLLALTLLPAATAAGQVRFERTGYRLTSIGEKMAVSARVLDARRRAASTRIRWHIADSTIATVTPAGVITSRKPGFTKLWAVAGGDSASALILVDQWAAKFDFYPAVVRFDAVGSKVPLRVQVRDAAGHLIANDNGRGAACRSINDRIARLAPNGEVTARSNGVTYVRCTDRGVADSVRIEVRQRPAKVIIADKVNLGTKVVGDTFQLRLSAIDRVGDEIRDVQATWASLNTNVLSVDPLTGRARAIAPSPGPIKVVAQVGDATDTVAIAVNAPMGMTMAVADTSTGLPSLDAPRTPTLSLQSLYMIVGDTGRISAQAKDASGNPIPNPGLIFRSNDTSIVSPISTRAGQAWVAKQTGITYIVAQFGTVLDSLQVSVRAKGSAVSTSLAGAAAVAFERPRFDTLGARRAYARRLDSAAAAIRRTTVVRDLTGRMLSLSAIAGPSAHATFLDSSTIRSVTEKRSGLVYGGRAELVPLSGLSMTADFRAGQLNAPKSGTGEDLSLTELQGDLMYSPAQWFSFGGGYLRRAERTELATQRWYGPRATLASRLTFVGGAVNTLTAVTVLPATTFTGLKDDKGKEARANAFSLAGEAGVEVRSGVFTAAVTYYVDRFSFPELGGVKRRDQFSMVRVKLGLQAGQ